MDLPLDHFIKPGLVHFMAFPACQKGEGPVILESLKKVLADEYFEVIEMAWIKDPATRAKARAMIVSSGIDARYGAHPRILSQRLDLNSLDSAIRQRAVDDLKLGIDEAAEQGMRDYVLLSGWDVPPPQRPRAMDALELSLVELCAYAEGKGITVILEVFDRDIDKKCLIGPADIVAEIARRVKRSRRNFGVLVDLSHIPLLGEGPEQAILPVRDHLLHAHIGNCYIKDRSDPAWGDVHPRFGYPGGVNDVPQIAAFLKTLFEVGYLKADGSARRAVSFEIKPLGEEDPDLMLAAAKRKLGEAWQSLKL
jgi:sugar phosphate isomerase/epimerase